MPGINQGPWAAAKGSSEELSAADIGDQGPVEQTWYYPDGTVAYHQGDTVVMVLPNGDVASWVASSDEAEAAAASGDQLGMESEPSEPVTIGQAEEPDYFLIIE